MITPVDIEKKEFTKGVRGYNIDEVDEFLDQIIVDLEKLIKENLRLKTEVTALEEENKKYKGSEGEVVKVLQQARNLMSDISASAEKRAEVLMRNAELDAELTVREARERAQQLRDENKNLEKRYIHFRDRYKKYLEDELEHFNNLQNDLFPDFNGDRLEELVNAPMSSSLQDQQKATLPLEEEMDLEKALFANVDREESTDAKRTVIMHPADFRTPGGNR